MVVPRLILVSIFTTQLSIFVVRTSVSSITNLINMNLIKSFFLLYFILVSMTNHVIAEENSTVKMIPKQPMIFKIINSLINSLPEDFCKDGGWIASCFNINKQLCMSEFRIELLNCSDSIKKEWETNSELVRCESREHCSEQFGAIGQELGQKLGSCAGEKFGQKFCQSFEKEKCIKYLESSGMPKDKIEKFISEIDKAKQLGLN